MGWTRQKWAELHRVLPWKGRAWKREASTPGGVSMELTTVARIPEIVLRSWAKSTVVIFIAKTIIKKWTEYMSMTFSRVHWF